MTGVVKRAPIRQRIISVRDRKIIAVSGAAPIATEIVEFFTSLDIPIREVYGQSEDTGPTTLNVPGKTRIGSVGPNVSSRAVSMSLVTFVNTVGW